jgi:hypothetical protein
LSCRCQITIDNLKPSPHASAASASFEAKCF